MPAQSPPPRAFPETLRWSESLADHSRVLVRPITSRDKDAERAFIEGLTPESRHFRFLGQVGSPSERLLADLTEIDYAHDMAFVAVVPGEDAERIVGVSRYATDPDGLRCECAITVEEDWQHRGLGTLLMKHLIEVARSRGIRTMYSIDAADNQAMTELARFLGFQSRPEPGDPRQVIHELQL